MNSVEIYSEMEYGRMHVSKTIAKGEACGIKYYIESKGTHPCAYVVVTQDEADSYGYDNDDGLAQQIECHGGITYGGKLNVVSDIEDDETYVLGWDYAHYGDYVWCGYEDEGISYNDPYDRRHTVDEMIKDCINVAMQIASRRAAQKAYEYTYNEMMGEYGTWTYERLMGNAGRQEN